MANEWFGKDHGKLWVSQRDSRYLRRNKCGASYQRTALVIQQAIREGRPAVSKAGCCFTVGNHLTHALAGRLAERCLN